MNKLRDFILLLIFYDALTVSGILETSQATQNYRFMEYINIKGKPGKVKKIIKNILKRGRESDTYPATDSRHRWSVQKTTKNDN